MKLLELTDENFARMIGDKKRMIIDCWADWCGPCRTIRPIVEELVAEFNGSAVFATLDVDSNPNTASELGIMAIPALLFYKDGELVDQTVGLLPKETIEGIIREKL